MLIFSSEGSDENPDPTAPVGPVRIRMVPSQSACSKWVAPLARISKGLPFQYTSVQQLFLASSPFLQISP